MSTALSSPELLRALWDRYAELHVSTLRGKPSKRNLCAQLGWDGNVLSKWMKSDAPNHRRIPLERIEQLAVALRLTQAETDRLMHARIRELGESDPSVTAAVKWAIDAARRATRRRLELSDEESRLVVAFRQALEQYPRGLYGDAEENVLMFAQMQVLLERAEGLHIEEASAEHNAPCERMPERQARLDRLLTHLRKQASFANRDAIKQAKKLGTKK